MKQGRPVNNEIEPAIKKILEKSPYINRNAICKRYKDMKGYGVGYGTMEKALRGLIKEGIVEEVINNKSETRLTAVYYLSDGRKRR